MEFALIMGIGTVVAIIVVANMPKWDGPENMRNPFAGNKHSATPVWKKDIIETYANGDLEYLEKLERHQKDPQHWACPFPPDKSQKQSCD